MVSARRSTFSFVWLTVLIAMLIRTILALSLRLGITRSDEAVISNLFWHLFLGDDHELRKS